MSATDWPDDHDALLADILHASTTACRLNQWNAWIVLRAVMDTLDQPEKLAALATLVEGAK